MACAVYAYLRSQVTPTGEATSTSTGSSTSFIARTAPAGDRVATEILKRDGAQQRGLQQSTAMDSVSHWQVLMVTPEQT